MPTISEFYGIVIRMFPKDHPPLTFMRSLASIERVPQSPLVSPSTESFRPVLPLVREWAELHRSELATNWEPAEQMRPLQRIEPLP